MRSNLSSLIRDPRLERLELSLSNPNFFNILKVANTEIRHSNFLAWLLDPSAGHNLGDKFVRWFLKDVFSDRKILWINEFAVDKLRMDELIIRREFKGIDLLLETKTFVVVIENKLWSSEHSDQLEKYVGVAKREFPNKEHAFVFLTPYGDEPESEDDGIVYINYDYAALLRILETILETYGESTSERTKVYLYDYVATIRRHIMKEDDAINLAQEIYRNHKEALDFIIENKPDRMLEVAPVFIQAIKDAGYVPETQNKGYARFLTKKLHEIIPRTGLQGWKNNEAFLFEISYWSKNTTLKCVVSPGHEGNKKLIIEALQPLPGARDPRTKIWSTILSHPHRINVQADKYDDLLELKNDVDEMMRKEGDFIKSVEERITAISERFVVQNGT